MRHTYRPRTRGFTQHQLAQRRGAGFTLIELMVVVAIVGMIAGLIIPAIKQYVDQRRKEDAAKTIACTGSAGHTEAIRTAERAGLNNAEVVGAHDYVSDARRLGCWATSDAALEVEGIDRKEQRVRLTVCCHPAAGIVKCAIPLPMHPFPGDR